MRELLNTNTKLLKTIDGFNFLIRGLSLAPANFSGHEVCAWRGACSEICSLWFSGRTVTASVRNAAIERAQLFFNDRPSFIRQLCAEIVLAGCKAAEQEAQLLIRLNTASDIVWERIAPQVLEVVSSVGGIAYDYTKARPTQRATLPNGYHLSHSVHEKTTMADIRNAIDMGRNVVPVIAARYQANGKAEHHKFGMLPESIRFVSGSDEFYLPCVDGDKIDARIPAVDGQGVAVVLRGKGGRAKVKQGVEGGFIFPVSDWQHGDKYASTLEESGIVKGTLLTCHLSA